MTLIAEPHLPAPSAAEQPTPELLPYGGVLEGCPAPVDTQCANPIGCMAVKTLYDAANGPGFRDQAHCNDPLPTTRGARLVQAVDAEGKLNGRVRCLRCPLRRDTVYVH